MKKKLLFSAVALAAFWLGACNNGGESAPNDLDSRAFASMVKVIAEAPTDNTEPIATANIGKGAYASDEVDEPISA